MEFEVKLYLLFKILLVKQECGFCILYDNISLALIVPDNIILF